MGSGVREAGPTNQGRRTPRLRRSNRFKRPLAPVRSDPRRSRFGLAVGSPTPANRHRSRSTGPSMFQPLEGPSRRTARRPAIVPRSRGDGRPVGSTRPSLPNVFRRSSRQPGALGAHPGRGPPGEKTNTTAPAPRAEIGFVLLFSTPRTPLRRRKPSNEYEENMKIGFVRAISGWFEPSQARPVRRYTHPGLASSSRAPISRAAAFRLPAMPAAGVAAPSRGSPLAPSWMQRHPRRDGFFTDEQIAKDGPTSDIDAGRAVLFPTFFGNPRFSGPIVPIGLPDRLKRNICGQIQPGPVKIDIPSAEKANDRSRRPPVSVEPNRDPPPAIVPGPFLRRSRTGPGQSAPVHEPSGPGRHGAGGTRRSPISGPRQSSGRRPARLTI